MSFLSYFSSEDFMPHGHCFLWRPDLMLIHVLSDSTIALAYYSIPFALLYFVHRRPDVLFRSVAVLFGLFILACGTTHVLGIVVLWHPIYWVDGGVKVVTALASIATAIVVWRQMPTALALPSHAQLRDLNAQLAKRVRLRTRELEAALEAKNVLLQELHHRVKNNLHVASGLLAMQAQAHPGLRPHLQETSARLQAMGRIHDQLHRSHDMAALDLGLYLQGLAGDLDRIFGRQDIRTKVMVPQRPVRLSFDVANPVVLVINEAISNAFKHAYPAGRGGDLTVSVEWQGEAARVAVTDYGTGIPADRRDGGSMGLRLMRMLATQVAADLTVESGARGTTVMLALPRNVLAPEAGA